jgi:DNA gyrase subunit A
MSVLHHLEAEVDERQAYSQAVAARRRLGVSDYEGKDDDKSSDTTLAARLEEPDFVAMAQREQFILSLTANGFGKRSSSFEYRTTNRGGSGIINIETSERNGPVVASFPVADRDDIMLVTDRGKLIRIPVGDIRVAGRNTQGVIVFKTGEEEKVVSAAHLGEDDAADEANEEGVKGDEVAEGSETDASPEEE